MHKRKRSSFPPNRSNKRTFKRKRFSRRRTAGVTSKSSTGLSFGFKSKKISRKSWNHKLWDSTLQKQHQRSNAAFSDTLLAPPLISQYGVNFRFALPSGVSPFWTAAGGAISQDVAQPLPQFSGDIVIRGGMIGLRVCNDVSSLEPMTVIIYLIRTGDKFNNANAPIQVFEGWDPSLIPDFSTDIGRIVMRRKFLMENANSAEVTYRLPIQKIEEAPFNNLSNQYAWMILVNNNQGTVLSNVTAVRYHNLSFVGDIVA